MRLKSMFVCVGEGDGERIVGIQQEKYVVD